MTKAIATTNQNSTALSFNDADKKNLKNSICKTLDDNEFETFIKVCVDSRLNPFKRQIYAIKRSGKGGPVVTYQTGIDGFRAIAGRTGQHVNTKIFWKAKGEDWVDFWEEDAPPVAAKAEVYKSGSPEPFVATARFKSYKVNTNPLWNSMPENMIAKCAEALALRKAFPEDLSGLHSAEEMAQADHQGAHVIEAESVGDLSSDMVATATELYTAADHQKGLAFRLMKEAGHDSPEAMSELNRLLIEGKTVFSEEAIKLAIKEETEGL
jgi:phage recombination protein Bet